MYAYCIIITLRNELLEWILDWGWLRHIKFIFWNSVNASCRLEFVEFKFSRAQE